MQDQDEPGCCFHSQINYYVFLSTQKPEDVRLTRLLISDETV